MATSSCPVLDNILVENECLENYAGLGFSVYVGVKSDLVSPLTLTNNVYSTPVFYSGAGLYKFECKEDSQQIQGTSLGRRNGFKLTANFILEAVNQLSSKISRALNNLDIFLIFDDGNDSQILYDPERMVVFDADGITSDTGASADDDRQINLSCFLSPVKYPNLYVSEPANGWDTLLATGIVTKYTVTVQVAEGQSDRGTVSGGGSVRGGESTTIKAVAASGFVFSKWSDGNTNATRKVSVTADATYTAEFVAEDILYLNIQVAVAEGQSDYGSVSGGNSHIAENSELTLTATANSGYHFVKWDDENTENPRTVTASVNKVYTAVFAKDPAGDIEMTLDSSAATVALASAGSTEIRYTDDGTTPTSSSKLYESPIALTSTTSISAIASNGEEYTDVPAVTTTYDADDNTLAFSVASGTITYKTATDGEATAYTTPLDATAGTTYYVYVDDVLKTTVAITE